MSAIPGQGIGHIPLNLGHVAPAQIPQGPGGTPAQGVGQARVGMGTLAGRQIQVGDGQQRQAASVHAERAKSFFKMAGKVLACIVLAPIALPVAAVAGVTRALLQIPRLVNEKLLEPRSDKKFEIANPHLTPLRAPMQGSVLNNPTVQDRLWAHAQAQKTPMTRQQIMEHVATGERIAQALGTPHAHQAAGGSPITLQVNGQPVQVDSSVHTTRALGWYMMAAAAQQNANRELSQDHATIGEQKVTDMSSSGSFVMKDPGNRIYSFMSAAPTADSRMSTHFSERVDHTETHKIAGFIPTSKPAQRGIEDYRNMLPGQGGTMLFDKLAARDGTQDLFVKFESVGCPPYFRKEPHQGISQGIARFFSALDRNIGHATSFVGSRFQGESEEMRRQEHVYKGTLKDDVAEPFGNLVNHAIQSGVIDASSKAVGRSVHKFGMPFLREALDRIETMASQQNNAQILGEVAKVRQDMVDATAKLGAQSDMHGIERRGAETHISLQPAANIVRPLEGRLSAAANQQFNQEATQLSRARDITTPSSEAAGICTQAYKDWSRSTVQVGAATFAPKSDPAVTAGSLNILTGGDAHMNMLVSQYANQQSLGPLMDAIVRGDLKIHGPDGRPGIPLGDGFTTFDIQSSPAGGVTIGVRHTRDQVNNFQTNDPALGVQVTPTDPARSHADFAFQLSIGPAPGYAVAVSQPLRYEALIRA